MSFDSTWIIPVPAFSLLSIRKQSCFSLKGIRPSGTDSSGDAMLAPELEWSGFRGHQPSFGQGSSPARVPPHPHGSWVLGAPWLLALVLTQGLTGRWRGPWMERKEPCSPSFVWPPGHHAEAKSLEHRVAWGWVQSPQRVEPPRWRQLAFWRHLCLQSSTLPEADGHLCSCGSSPELSRSKPTAMLQLRCGYPVSRFPTSWRLGDLGVNSNLLWSPNEFYVWWYVNLQRKSVVFHDFEAQLKWFLQNIF